MKFIVFTKESISQGLLGGLVLLCMQSVSASTLSGGEFSITYNNNSDLLAGLNLGPGTATSYRVAGFFDQSLADTHATTATMIATADFAAPSTLDFSVNPSDLNGTGIPFGSGGRSNQATSLTWDASQDALLNSPTFLADGVVGLNGVIMNRGSFTGTLLSGDYGFEYVPARNNGTNSGWTLYNNVSFRSSSYDTRNLSVTTDGDELSMTGELWWSTNTSAFLFGGDGLTSAGMAGTFNLVSPLPQVNPSPVPVPAAGWLLGSGLLGLLTKCRRSTKAIA